jgi:hypothetical protein
MKTITIDGTEFQYEVYKKYYSTMDGGYQDWATNFYLGTEEKKYGFFKKKFKTIPKLAFMVLYDIESIYYTKEDMTLKVMVKYNEYKDKMAESERQRVRIFEIANGELIN